MQNRVFNYVALMALTGLLLAGMSQSPVRAEDDYHPMPKHHHSLVFRNPDGSPHKMLDRLNRYHRHRAGTKQDPAHAERSESPRSSTENRNRAATSAENAGLICPVTGDKIASVEAAADHSDYKGKTYYFCCADCKSKFDKNPAEYVKKAEAGKYEKMEH